MFPYWTHNITLDLKQEDTETKFVLLLVRVSSYNFWILHPNETWNNCFIYIKCKPHNDVAESKIGINIDLMIGIIFAASGRISSIWINVKLCSTLMQFITLTGFKLLLYWMCHLQQKKIPQLMYWLTFLNNIILELFAYSQMVK